MTKLPGSAGVPDSDWQHVIIEDTVSLVARETWRDGSEERERLVQKNLGEIRDYFAKKAEAFGATYPNAPKIEQLEWRKDNYRVFSFRAGAAEGKGRKVSLICHLDTVPPGSTDWSPFKARQETREYKGAPARFLIGRGAIDDKGPAVVAFEAFTRALRIAGEQSVKLDNVALEVLFDTSEETDMSMPHYFEEQKGSAPDVGIVFDAMWSVRAEKGIERPVFTVVDAERPAGAPSRPTIVSLRTSSGSANMIPVTTEAVIACADPAAFVRKIQDWYRVYSFDDPQYHPAELSASPGKECVVLRTKVAGAQHGSAPHQNRDHGANPLVSMASFLASLFERGIVADNHNATMCHFIKWAFGTRVFGENHPDLLYRFDPVFTEGNGTTYGLTQLVPTTVDGRKALKLSVDVRYAVGHHATGWDGTEGKLSGVSLFGSIFRQLVDRYTSEMGLEGRRISVETQTVFGPDIRDSRDANLFRIDLAYRSVMGDNCPMLAIGGATDAHGWPQLVTAGALMTDCFGPPVNYHGIDEGAPLSDLENSGKILLQVLLQELGCSQRDDAMAADLHASHGCAI